MARSTLKDLSRLAGARNHILDAAPYVENIDAAVAEDQTRLRALNKAIKNYPGQITASEAERLTRALLNGHRSGEFSTPASAQSWAAWRLAGVEQLWRLVLGSGVARCHTWTGIVPGWIRTSDELKFVTAKQLTEQFRALLNRNGATKAQGWLIGKLDCEFDTHNRLYRFHLHGVACGPMIDVLDAARKSATLLPQRTGMIVGRRVTRPMQIDRKPLTNLPMPLSYVLKSHFSARWLGTNDQGQVKRGRNPMRIPEPYGTQSLMWLHDQQLQDMFVMMNLAVRDRQLVVRT